MVWRAWSISRSRKVSRVCLEVDSQQLCDSFADDLAGLLKPYRKVSHQHGCAVAIRFISDRARGDVILGEDWRIVPHDDLLQDLKNHYGPEKVQLKYG